MEKEEFQQLVEKVYQGTASHEEIAKYNYYYMLFQTDTEWDKNIHGESDLLEEEIYNNINKSISKKKGPDYKPWGAIAASVIAILAIAIYYSSALKPIALLTNEGKSIDITPGRDKATLILGNGTEISLEQIANGEVIKQGGAKVSKSKDGLLVYETLHSDNASSSQFNTIIVPRGGQYKVVLPDGTNVWLNSSSSIRYPTKFDLSERRVELQGEAYFEVVANKNRPFIVLTEKETVKVLGTEFNVSAYPDDKSSNTTLLGGKVEVSPRTNANLVKVLRPGQQSIVYESGIRILQVDTNEAVAWKNGEFMFNRETIESVMRKIARWYDVDVIYEKPIGPEVKIWGTVSRFDNISEVLKFIERTKAVYFKVEGRKVYVMK